jgi:Domain of unknown function (DUF3598)
MKNQMQRLAMHLGRWEGMFTDFSPEAKLLGQKSSVILFEEAEPNVIRQTNRYPGCEDKAWEYRDLSAGIRFFEDGSFSNGRSQLAPFSAFAAEQGFLYEDQKARIVQLFDVEGKASAITTIQEVRGRTYQTPASLNNPLEGFLGTWKGKALVLSPDWPEPEKLESELIFEKDGAQIHRQFKMGAQTFDWIGNYEDSAVSFDDGRMVFFPGNLMTMSPPQLPLLSSDKSFSIEIGWLVDPRTCLRMIRYYDHKGSWQKVVLIKEQSQGF